MIEKKEESYKEAATIDELDKFRRWLHNHGIINMTWYDNKWEWQPTEVATIFLLYGGAAIAILIQMWIF